MTSTLMNITSIVVLALIDVMVGVMAIMCLVMLREVLVDVIRLHKKEKEKSK